MNRTYGYVRVSSKDQNEDRQLITMKEFGVSEQNIFRDKQSGKNFDRPAYQKLLRKIKPVDAFVIKSIDRLGRDYEEIIEHWRIISKERRGRHCCPGYAAAGYPSKRPGLDGYVYY